ncbi:MAG: hypothetical protein CSA11_00205 [Chloroflexi bacterium]|nr:MAG: hypothetical protein CSB13_10685 [Chloroflexota bacterium]PIE82519.1 MAG: hypothetical protein CSA11_00205 [Chloroflexota bacterium]
MLQTLTPSLQTFPFQTSPIKRQYHQWKAQIESKQASQAEFEKWLFLHAATVLFEEKAGELLTLMADQFGLTIRQQVAYVDQVACLWDVAYRVVHETDFSLKFVIYQPHMVQAQLNSVPPCMLQDELEYPVNITPAQFLAEIERRWLATNSIPHEVGFALGYPVKDVLGFMGLQPMVCSGCCGWQVYGEFAPSQQLGQRFLEARLEAIRFLHCPVKDININRQAESCPPFCKCQMCS